MKSFQVLTLFGIRILIHPTFFILPLFFALFYGYHYGSAVGFRAFMLVVLIFVCVLLHELSHGLRAQKLGIRVPSITLYPIGGVASMQKIPKEPWQEFSISIVGPLTNFGIAAILFFPLYFTIGPDALYSPSLETWPQTLANVFWANPVLGLFNLIPAFPMDGGRILRSALSGHLGYLRATRISVYFGHLFAILFLLLGIWKQHWMLVFVALFIYTSASREEKYAVYENELERLKKDSENASG